MVVELLCIVSLWFLYVAGDHLSAVVQYMFKYLDI